MAGKMERKERQVEKRNKMKPILCVLFCTFFSVKSKVTSLDESQLIKAGDSAILFCDHPEAKWKFNAEIIADCKNCPSLCDVKEPFKGRVTASCNGANSVIHFKSTKSSDKGLIKCPSDDSTTFDFLVGNYDDHLHPENNKYKFALKNEDYTLICDKENDAEIIWYNQLGETLSIFYKDCENLYSIYDKEKFTITCDVNEKKGKLVIKSVTLKDDGQIFGCESAGKLSLYRLTVNDAVTFVSIKQQSETLIENKDSQSPSQSPDNTKTYIVVACIILATVIMIIFGGIFYAKFWRSKKRKHSKNYPADSTQLSEGDESEYAGIVSRSSDPTYENSTFSDETN